MSKLSPSDVVLKAEFNPGIQKYILWYVAFLTTISLVGIPLLLVWFLGFGQYVSKRYYENIFCTLTKHHLQFKKGVFFKVEKTIPLENIQDLTFIENPILNYLDLKILKVETAGNSNAQGSDMKLIGIKDAGAFKEEVLKQRELISSKNASGFDQEAGESTQLLREIKDILTQIRDKS